MGQPLADQHGHEAPAVGGIAAGVFPGGERVAVLQRPPGAGGGAGPIPTGR